MTYLIVRTKKFKKDVQTYLAHGGSDRRLSAALHALAVDDLPPWLRDHQLQGNMRYCRELHVEGDWLLVYRKDGTKLVITCLWLVSHKTLRERERNL